MKKIARGSKKRERPGETSSSEPIALEVEDIEDIVSNPGLCFHPDSFHDFSADEVSAVRARLLSWYDENQRELPWRKPSPAYFERLKQEGRPADPRKVFCEATPYDRAYAVLVSELMLQQTQVATVLTYFQKWMRVFPTIDSLAAASLEQVNEVWAGLGYYRRAKLLHECAQKIVNEESGIVPASASKLRELPGIGPYTAGAVSSIAYDAVEPIVDGNVVRVLARMRALKADLKGSNQQKLLWKLAGSLVDLDRPGDFNQSLMELGATICTPQSPKCSECPVYQHCHAFAEIKIGATPTARTSMPCSICTSNPVISQVSDYPLKSEKKPPKPLSTYVAIVYFPVSSDQIKFILVQRPSTGLLANMWEFPSFDLPHTLDAAPPQEELMNAHLLSQFHVTVAQIACRKRLGVLTHTFSHILQTIHVECIELSEAVALSAPHQKWIESGELKGLAVTKSLHKCFALFLQRDFDPAAPPTKRPKKKEIVSKSQLTLDSMFAKTGK